SRPPAARRAVRSERARRPRALVLGQPAARRFDARGARAVRNLRARRGEGGLGAQGQPPADRERPATTDRHDPRPPDRVSCCDDPSLRPPPAGGELSRRAFVARSLGLALSVYGAGRLGVFDAGIATAAAPNRVLISVFLEGGADALALLYPGG